MLAMLVYVRGCRDHARARVAIINLPRCDPVAGEFEKFLSDDFVVGQSSKPNTLAGIRDAIVLVGCHDGPP
jgi:hypothetical protein